MRELPTIKSLAKARSQRIHKLWEGLGYYSRARNLHRAAQRLLSMNNGQFPKDFSKVIELPGIGRYTAGAICSIAFNQPYPVLDGNVIRVLTRLFAISSNPRAPRTNSRLWQIAEQFVTIARNQGSGSANVRACSAVNQSLMELGALICTPRQSRCDICPVSKYCLAYKRNAAEKFPKLPSRIRASPRRFVALVAQEGERFLVRQRPPGIVNGHLWEFPNIEIKAAGQNLQDAAQALCHCPLGQVESLCRIRHSITRYRITLEVFRASVDGREGRSKAEGRWLHRRQLKRLPFPGAHKKILDRL